MFDFVWLGLFLFLLFVLVLRVELGLQSWIQVLCHSVTDLRPQSPVALFYGQSLKFSVVESEKSQLYAFLP